MIERCAVAKHNPNGWPRLTLCSAIAPTRWLLTEAYSVPICTHHRNELLRVESGVDEV